MSRTRIKVLLSDSREIFREGLACLLENQPNIEVVYRCQDGKGTLEKAREVEPDVVLMDTFMPDQDSIEVVKHIDKSLPNTRVAMLTDCQEEEKLFSALISGAKGYLLKDIELNELVKSIDLVAKGEVVVSPPLGGRLLRELGTIRKIKEPGHLTGSIDLSERENEILKLIAKGETNKEIAKGLVVAENTVKVHIKNILEKLQLRNKQQAAAYAVKKGLVTDIDGNKEESG